MSQLVSIIIPTYNRVHLICETLDSIVAQTYKNWECIIVDDGSTDDSMRLIQKYIESEERFKYFRRPAEKLKGPSSCRNFGFEKAKGLYVIFLDSDDLLLSTCLHNRLKFAREHSEYDFFIFKTELFSKQIGDINKVFNTPLECYSDEAYLNLLLKGFYPFCVSSVLWKSDKIRKIKGFDESMSILEDPELHIRAFHNKFLSITSNLSSDNFYRKDLSVKNSFCDHEKLLKSTYRIYSLYLNFYPIQMREYCLRFYRIEILLKKNLNDALTFYLLFLSSKILNFKQKIVIPILIIYKILKIENCKGLGFYTITKKHIK